jgi:branched-chain amino acid transport system permease protein
MYREGCRLFLCRLIAIHAGVLLVWFNGRISPGTEMSPRRSSSDHRRIGGMRHPIGPFIGAVVVVLMQTFRMISWALSGSRSSACFSW